ncbi:dUTP diphosphatase [Calderihabitans maritimus]|uniref:dUTP diphosphatase n=1 Tax=Calderihabitans maritimus TaxID=1246530 RepID=A0A1Z5HQC2_9FIRM|nr:dUTP diphosphatase [Calderihabitans maritimus]GAW91732.1 deoxyuridine 5`-triphosphate nucleotidohydrolase [Calderihabitans maritimus]
MGRRFEVISDYQNKNIRLPRRKTRLSAGYDLEAAEDIVLEPKKVTFIPTGLKVYMEQDEVLQIFIRSGLSSRNAVSLINGTGIIDADYVDNPQNEGHILIPVFNHGDEPIHIRKGQAVAQGIFIKYLLTDDDQTGEQRQGGFGSTGQ